MEKTKAEGYEALRKIEEILEGFDPEDSYIGKAFEGCVEQAKENLRYDGKMSWKAEYESKNREVARLTEKLAEVNKRLRESEVARVDLTKELNQKDDAIARLEDAKKEYEKEIESATLAKRDYEAQIGQLQNDYKALQISHEELKQARSHMVAQELVDLRQTVLELKAKLYDMMTGEEVSG